MAGQERLREAVIRSSRAGRAPGPPGSVNFNLFEKLTFVSPPAPLMLLARVPDRYQSVSELAAFIFSRVCMWTYSTC